MLKPRQCQGAVDGGIVMMKGGTQGTGEDGEDCAEQMEGIQAGLYTRTTGPPLLGL